VGVGETHAEGAELREEYRIQTHAEGAELREEYRVPLQ
jgi:hypothetical protein